LLPDDLEGLHHCFSCGVGPVSGFERDCAERGMKVYLADGSVDQPEFNHPLFHFTRKHIKAFEAPGQITLDAFIQSAQLGDAEEFLIQMDIEKSEYEVLLSASPDIMQRARIIIVEMHALHRLASQASFPLLNATFLKLLETHRCVHIHPNNTGRQHRLQGLVIPQVMEFTFCRRDRGPATGWCKTFPHALDQDNQLAKPARVLPSDWYAA